MKKALMIIGGIVLAVIVIFLVIYFIISATSNKLKCTSDEGNITIMYNDKTITGYTASGITYDMDGQNEVVEVIGIDEYVEQFKTWFSSNTTGSCE